ncbi:MAG: restriction endonuclease [Bryobacteraceae bacterium]
MIHQIVEPPAPVKPSAPKPPTGVLATLGIGAERHDYERARAAYDAALKRYEEDCERCREQIFAARERAVAESIWQDIHTRLPPDTVDRMTGVEFEGFLCQLFVKMGYSVQTTRASGDQGGDLILTEPTGKRRAVVQAKRSSKPVSNRAVQEVLGAMAYYKCPAGIVITNGEFTASALELAAKDKRLAMWDGTKLATAYVENFPTAPSPFDRSEYDELIERLRHSPRKAPISPSRTGRWQDQSPTEAQVALIWRKDATLKAQFKNWRSLFVFAVEQHGKGDDTWSKGGVSLRLNQFLGQKLD